MKPSKLLAFAFLFLIAAIFSTGCSDSGDSPDSPKGVSGFEDLTRSDVSVAYDACEYHLYDQLNGDTDWKEIDLYEIVGYSFTTPSRLTFANGKTWTPFSLWSCAEGPSIFSTIWWAYTMRVPNQSLYVESTLEYDPEKGIAMIDNQEFEVIECYANKLVLSHIEEYWGGVDNRGGHFKEIVTFRLRENWEYNEANDHCFPTYLDGYQFIIDAAREEFGDIVPVNEVFKGIMQCPYAEWELDLFQSYLEILKRGEEDPCHEMWKYIKGDEMLEDIRNYYKENEGEKA